MGGQLPDLRLATFDLINPPFLFKLEVPSGLVNCEFRSFILLF